MKHLLIFDFDGVLSPIPHIIIKQESHMIKQLI